MKLENDHTVINTNYYNIYVGENLFGEIGKLIDLGKYSKIIVLTDSTVGPLYLKSLIEKLAKFNSEIYSYKMLSGEKFKNLKTVSKIYKFFIKQKVDRNSLVINLGGGVVSDLGGFTSSTFLRGIKFINIPTTLEAMVDASIGGKTGVNFLNYKNYIGTFSQPIGVFADIKTLKTLPDRILIQGFAEAIKHGLIKDSNYFKIITSKKLDQFTKEELITIVTKSIKIKADIVSQDHIEMGIRKILNFGHTIGHAFESISLETEDLLYHGEAVAIGMIAEAKISTLMGMLSKKDFEIIEKSIALAGLPTKYNKKVSFENLLKVLQADKKSVNGTIKWSLLNGIGKCSFNIDVKERYVHEAIKCVL